MGLISYVKFRTVVGNTITHKGVAILTTDNGARL